MSVKKFQVTSAEIPYSASLVKRVWCVVFYKQASDASDLPIEKYNKKWRF